LEEELIFLLPWTLIDGGVIQREQILYPAVLDLVEAGKRAGASFRAP